ncbi:MAG: hypothetical protein FWD78_05710 [Treponema sp.]|nr:hypothetical protein [Treponema sp.]
MNQTIKIPFNGSIDRGGPALVPHTRAFASALMSLSVLMGAPHDTRAETEHNRTYRADYDYYRHLLVSGEGFLFWQDVWNYLTPALPRGSHPAGFWEPASILPIDTRPLLDCFEIAGIRAEIITGQIGEKTLGNLAQGYPVLLFGGNPGDRILLAIGYRSGGEDLLAWKFSAGDDRQNKSFAPDKCKYISDWTCDVIAVALIKSAPNPPANVKTLLYGALERGAGLLRNDIILEAYCGWFTACEVCAGASCAGNSGADMAVQNKVPQVQPQIWDLAERRYYLSKELEEVQRIFGTEQLAPAIRAAKKIHDNMWLINSINRNERLALNDAAVRSQIAQILTECRKLDLEIADCIFGFLNNFKP